jgi:RNA polymerase sigma-70 factor (ECF subfamily)
MNDFEAQLTPMYAEAVRFARGLAGSNADGDDVLQDALVRAWRGYPKLRETERFRPWLLKIIGNTYRSWVQRRKLKNWLTLEFVRNVPAPSRDSLDSRDLLQRALQDLPPEQREALVLFELTGSSIEEISDLQQVTISAVKSRLVRGRKRLRKSLDQLEDGGMK